MCFSPAHWHADASSGILTHLLSRCSAYTIYRTQFVLHLTYLEAALTSGGSCFGQQGLNLPLERGCAIRHQIAKWSLKPVQGPRKLSGKCSRPTECHLGSTDDTFKPIRDSLRPKECPSGSQRVLIPKRAPRLTEGPFRPTLGPLRPTEGHLGSKKGSFRHT